MVLFAKPTIASMVIGFFIASIGEVLRASGVFYVGSETRVTGSVGASRLVTSGPFGYVRNPLYVGNMLIYIGIGIMSLALFPWLQAGALLYFVLQYTLIVREEETFLKKEFGKEYEHYIEAVPRFLCRLTPYHSPKPVTITWKDGWKSEARSLQAFSFVIIIIIALWLVR